MTRQKDFDRWMAQDAEIRTLRVENARLRAQADALATALEEAKANLIWATGGWGQATEEVLKPARVTLHRNVAAIDAALRAYREGDCPGCSFQRQTGGNHDDVPTGDADPNCPYREGS